MLRSASFHSRCFCCRASDTAPAGDSCARDRAGRIPGLPGCDRVRDSHRDRLDRGDPSRDCAAKCAAAKTPVGAGRGGCACDPCRRSGIGAFQRDAVAGKEPDHCRGRHRLHRVVRARPRACARRPAGPSGRDPILLAARGAGAGGGTSEPATPGPRQRARAGAAASEDRLRLPLSPLPARAASPVAGGSARRPPRPPALQRDARSRVVSVLRAFHDPVLPAGT